ncbi:hypothetical protein GII33_23155 (plasmid) [Gordonia pseudamarae]|jgi:hypothetical protein|uniref:hypothetical protein n=1 Tax=Gordonia pseudamarae TaxID=2831662 RepID=UPI001AF12B10|nr:hypothetical protein [Gordonia pseudamarae]QHN28983.1 hypothetical protein GII33_23155 [Gordonia pseudamarae]
MFFAERRLRACAVRVAAAHSPVDGWQWARWDELVGVEVGISVHTVRTEFLESGEITGVALRGTTLCRIVIPASVSLEHQIHVAAHEAWHLIDGHDRCQEGADEAAAERFAGYVGLAVDRFTAPQPHRWYRAVSVG